MTDLFRFMSFPTFVQVAQSRELTFVHYRLWDDPYEGFVLRALETEAGRRQVQEWLSVNGRSIFGVQGADVLKAFCDTAHLQSWSKCPESDAMWRIYAFDKFAIRVGTTLKAARQIPKLDHVEVSYRPVNLDEELRSIFVGNQMFGKKVFATKRQEFAHEQEVRLVTDFDGNILNMGRKNDPSTTIQMRHMLMIMQSKGEITAEELEHGMADLNQSEKQRPVTKQIPFGDISGFVTSVLIHPMAPDWFVETVKVFCLAQGLPFHGRSTLYTFKHSG